MNDTTPRPVEELPDVPAAPTAEEVAAQNEAASRKLMLFAQTVNQGEWLQITRLLDRTRDQIAADDSLTALALAWVKLKRDGSPGCIDHLLSCTDQQIADVHGIVLPGYED